MIVVVPSVPHTGTHFILQRVMPDFSMIVKPNKFDGKDNTSLTVISGHFELRWYEKLLGFIKKYPVAIPLRHPARCLASYKRRYKQQAPFKFVEQWDCLLASSRYFKNPMYLHLDDLDIRETEAKNIRDRVGGVGHVDWSVTEETGSVKGTHDIEITDEMLVGIPQRFIDFYENTK